MRRTTLLFLLSLLPLLSHANDGAFYASGGTLFPLKETDIQLKKEYLGIMVDPSSDKKIVYVTVDFTFFNPGEAKEITVGFVTPPASGDVMLETHPRITGFTAVMNSDTLPWKVWRCDSSGFRIRDTLSGGNDFIYFFKAKFNKGLNTIRHTYSYRAAGGVDWEYEVSYRITTGCLWANKEIEDFTLDIAVKGGDYFYGFFIFTLDIAVKGGDCLPWTFYKDGHPAAWTITGSGKLGAEKTKVFPFDEMPWMRSVTLGKDAKVTLHELHFRPDDDLEFNKFRGMKTITPLDPKADGDALWFYSTLMQGNDDSLEISKLSDDEIRYIKNGFFAFHGYIFKNKKWQDLFSKYEWYLPDPSVKSDAAVLAPNEQRVLHALEAEEKRRKKNSK